MLFTVHVLQYLKVLNDLISQTEICLVLYNLFPDEKRAGSNGIGSCC